MRPRCDVSMRLLLALLAGAVLVQGKALMALPHWVIAPCTPQHTPPTCSTAALSNPACLTTSTPSGSSSTDAGSDDAAQLLTAAPAPAPAPDSDSDPAPAPAPTSVPRHSCEAVVAAAASNSAAGAPVASTPGRTAVQLQDWCTARGLGAGMSADASSSHKPRPASHRVAFAPHTVLGGPAVSTCEILATPADIPAYHDFVGMRVLPGASHTYEVVVMACPGDLWFLSDITHSPHACAAHSDSITATCTRWGSLSSSSSSSSSSMCAPPGLAFAHTGEMRAQGSVLVLQVRWLLDASLHNQAVTLQGAGLELIHEQPPQGQQTQVLGSFVGHVWTSAVAASAHGPAHIPLADSLLVGPGGSSPEYSCGRRCSFVPLGGLAGSGATVAAVSFQGPPTLTGVHISIQRCPLRHSTVVQWRLDDLQLHGQHTMHSLQGQDVRLYPGDQLSWSCTYNTISSPQHAGGLSASEHWHGCTVVLHYHPRSLQLRGCSAVAPRHGGHSICMHEAAGFVYKAGAEAGKVPARTLLAPHAMYRHPEPIFGFSSSVAIAWALLVSGFLWCCTVLLSKYAPDPVRAAYRRQPAAVRRAIPLYLLHIVVDPLLAAALAQTLFAGWCGCSEAILTDPWRIGLMLQYIAVSYAMELVWRVRVERVLAIHHVVTIVTIAVVAGELAPYLYRSADAVLLLAFFALQEQPTNVAMLAQRLLPEGSLWAARIWRAALGVGLVLKAVSLSLAGWLIWRDRDLMPPWATKLLLLIWVGMGLVQALSGRARMRMCTKAAESAQPFKRRRCC